MKEASISETLHLTSGVGELEEMARRATEKDEAVKLLLPQAALIAKWMTHKIGQPDITSVQSVYWSASPTAIFGVVDQVRTKLIQLIAQIRSDTGSANDPSRDAVENALNVVIHGNKSKVTVQAAQTGRGASKVTTQPTDISPPWWRTSRAIWTFVVGLAGIVAAVISYLQLTK